MPDYSSLSREELIERLHQSQRPTLERLSLVPSPPRQNGQQIYMGAPSEADLATINQLTQTSDPANSWMVIPYLASDNFLNYNYRTWSKNTLEQMSQRYKGSPHILNHAIDKAESQVGFIIDAQLYSDASPSDEIVNASIFGAENSKIASQDSYTWLCLKAAVRADTPFADAAMYRRANACSTGFWLYEPRTICPDCSEAMGREVEFEEVEQSTDKKGREVYSSVCPHTPISLMNLALWAYYGEGEPPLWSSYVIKDGRVDVIELSSCVDGALPATGIIRS